MRGVALASSSVVALDPTRREEALFVPVTIVMPNSTPRRRLDAPAEPITQQRRPAASSHHVHRPVLDAAYGHCVEVRRAAEVDLDRMVEVMFAEPGVEQLAFMPSIAGARRFSRAMWSHAGLGEFVVADDDGEVVGFAWWSENGISLRDGVRAAVAGWGPPGPIRLAVKGWPRQLVEIPMPAGPKLFELQVHPLRRGNGVGTTLLRHVINMVGRGSLSLTTRTDNPARRLYEGHGFSVTAEKLHRAYERRTGSRGRIVMIRPAPETTGSSP